MSFLNVIQGYCEETGMSQSAFERAAGLSKGQINKWKKGFHPGTKSQKKLASFIGISLEELMTMDEYTSPEKMTESRGEFRVPLISPTHPGNPVPFKVFPDISLDAENCFAMYMYDDSMSPCIEQGDLLLVDRSKEPSSGDVVVFNHTGYSLICRKVVFDETGLILQPYNTKYDARQYRASELAFYPAAITGKVVRVIKKYE